MNNEQNKDIDVPVCTTVSPEALALIDLYADARGLYRSNWIRKAISEKLAREVEAETGHSIVQART